MKNGARTVLLLAGDIAMLAVAFIVMLYIAFPNNLTSGIVKLHLLPFSILGVIWIFIFFIFNLYDQQATKPTIPHLRQIFLGFIVAGAIGVIFFYTVPFFGITPKTNLFIFTGVEIICFLLWRRIFYNIFSSYFKKNVAFIATGSDNHTEIKKLENYIRTYPQSGFNILGSFDTLAAFENSQRETVQVFIVSKQVWRDEKNFRKLFSSKTEVLDLAYAYEDILGRIPIDVIDEGWFMYNIGSPEKKIYDSGKRILSILIATLVLIITSPILLIIALIIKLEDRGPILYSQTRVGANGKNFELYKFRSMKVNAETNGPEWAKKHDARTTSIGKILRVLHIDELLQMINILKGDITLIGPRPERPEFVATLENEIPFYHLRHIITPGFTGWAQIKFRYAGSVMDSKEKFEYDLYYLKNRNIFMDLGIFARTLQIIFTHA